MKKTIFSLLLATYFTGSLANPFDSLITNIQRNNPQIIAIGKWLEASEKRSRTGIFPANPEISYNYLWGNSELFGDQKEFEVTQSFQFPGYYGSLSVLQRLQYEKDQAHAIKWISNVLNEATKTYLLCVWHTKKAALLHDQVRDSEKLVKVLQEGYESGEMSKIDFNKARIMHIQIENEWQKTQSQIDILKEQLRQYNGGAPMESIAYEYPPNHELPALDSLLNQLQVYNPEVRIADIAIKQGERQVKVEKMDRLPVFEAGFKSETILNQDLRGIHAGISLPLWNNKNRVISAVLENEFLQSSYYQVLNETRTALTSAYHVTSSQLNNYLKLKEVLEEEMFLEGRLVLLVAGQITFSEYYIEKQFLNESMLELLEVEKDFYLQRNVLLSFLPGFDFPY